jgi:hypothetical protein
MRKPSFGVTAFAVVTLSIVGMFRVFYEPLLPPSPTEYLVSVPRSEPQPAPIVEIGWKRSIEQAQSEGKRRKTGLMILFIDPSNIYAKQIELKVFRDPEMARFVNRTFVPVKINLDQFPEWGQVTQPLQRLSGYFEHGIELVVTNQDGELISHYVLNNPFQYYGRESLLPFLIESKSRLNQGSSFVQSNTSLQSMHDSDIQALINGQVAPIPAFAEFANSLRVELKSSQLGSLKDGSTKVSPMGLRLLSKVGHVEFSATTLKEWATTPLYDPIDGGFFREARVSPSASYIDTAKSSVQNALTAHVAAQLACATNDTELKRLAIDIGNEVLIDFLDGDGISTSRMNDQSVDMRSKRSSLTEKRLQYLLTSDQIASLMSFVTKSKSPDQDLISLKSLSALSDESFIRIRQTLRERLRSVPGLSEPEHIAIIGYIAARLFELYRYTDDKRFLTKGKELADDTFSALTEDSVAKLYGSRELGPGWLGSYLAVADCGLADYAVTGEIYPLRKGELALKQAIAKFQDARTGLLSNSVMKAGSRFAFSPNTPDLSDRDRESLNSHAIRLAFSYSIASEDEKTRAEFLSFAKSMMVRLNSVMQNANSSASGFYDAAFDLTENTSVMISGPNRVEVGNRLAKKLPFRMIYPMSVVNAPTIDLLYIRHGETLEGPYSFDQIQKKLSDPRG